MTYCMWADKSLHIHLKFEDIQASVSLSPILLVTDLGYRQLNHIHYKQGLLRSRNDPVSRSMQPTRGDPIRASQSIAARLSWEICIIRPVNHV